MKGLFSHISSQREFQFLIKGTEKNTQEETVTGLDHRLKRYNSSKKNYFFIFRANLYFNISKIRKKGRKQGRKEVES